MSAEDWGRTIGLPGLILGIVLLICFLHYLSITIKGWFSKQSARKHIPRARNLAESGKWEAAAGQFKTAIIKLLDDSEEVKSLTSELKDLYERNSVEADLTALIEAPKLLKEVSDAKVPQDEMMSMIAKIYENVTVVLDKYPGEIEEEG